MNPARRRNVHVPPRERDRRRVQQAAAQARAESNSALAVALAQIGAAFDETAMVNAFKMRVERLLALGPDHAAVRARFGARACLLASRNLDAGICVVDIWWRNECKAFAIASALGCATRLSLEVLRELRLILRLLRFKRMHAQYGGLLARLCEEAITEAAE